MTKNTHTHREAWLHEVTRCLEPTFKQHGFPLPVDIRLTCGFPSKKALLSQGRTRLGECWSADASDDRFIEIMVSPILADPMRVVGVLAHELIHAAVGNDCGHKGPFRKMAKKLGLEGKMTATTEGAAFKELIAPILEHVGPYPHAVLNARAKSSGPKKQTTRLLKAECPECGYCVRVTMKWVDEAGNPHCPQHGPMELV